VLFTRLGSVTLTVRALPLQGFVSVLPWQRKRRAAVALFMAGGAIGNFLAMAPIAVIAIALPGAGPAIGQLVAAQAVVGVVSLVPWPMKINGVQRGSDGMQLLRLLFRRQKDQLEQTHAFEQTHAKALRMVTPVGAELSPPSAEAREILFQITRRGIDSDVRIRRDVCHALRRVLDRDCASLLERLLVLGMLVGVQLTYRDTDATPRELDAWSLQALSISDSPGSRVTRGGVLVVLGRPHEAEAELRQLLDQPMLPADALGCRAFLAQAAAMRGDAAAARQWIAEARATIPDEHKSTLVPWLARLERWSMAPTGGAVPG
jgi:hypothetical protein